MKNKISTFEFAWYIMSGAIALWGLVYTVLGVICRFLKSTSALCKGNTYIASTFGLGFFWWGLILLGIGLALALIVLLTVAYKSSSIVDRTSKHAARLASINKLNENKVVDVETTAK